jgi:limonene 1,2-monooxygenase
MENRMRFGVFMSPYHAPGQNPTIALERDLALLEHLDRLGFDEAWIGEHHSGGFELIASPEVFIAMAAARTSRIRLGTGVSSVPYHHPLLLADRMVLLDHLTRGRIMLGAGPGALVADAVMMGIDPNEQRHQMEEGLEVLVRLLAGETVTKETSWFKLHEARLQLLPYQDPCFEIAVAAVRSPTGPRLAGQYGFGLLSIAATDPEGGFDFVADTWPVVEEQAALVGRVPDRRNWRMVTAIHLAETKAQAYENVRFGSDQMARFASAGPFSSGGRDIEEILANTSHEDRCDGANESGLAVIGTPDMAIAAIHRLIKQSGGGFGTLLLAASDQADREATLRSFELFGKYVMPEFQGSTVGIEASWDRLWTGRAQTSAVFRGAQDKAIAEHRAAMEARLVVGNG